MKRAISWKTILDRQQPFPGGPGPWLPRGRGCSEGDALDPVGGEILLSANMDHIVGFDPIQGRFECEAGTRMADILTISTARGWTLPVIPAHPEVTVGGAIANDIHDDGHLHQGNLGRHLLGLELLRSNGQRLWLEPGLRSHRRLLTATIGGLGLTGLITRVRLQLVPSPGTAVIIETHRYHHLDELWPMLEDQMTRWPRVCVAVDCLARRPRLGQGMLYITRPVPESFVKAESSRPKNQHRPQPPFATTLHTSIPQLGQRWLNPFHNLGSSKVSRLQTALDRWLFSPPRAGAFAMTPIDPDLAWIPYHARLPSASAQETVARILHGVANSGHQVMAGTLGVFGASPPSGLLSFAREGLGLSFRIRTQGDSTQRLLQDLDEIVIGVGGNLHLGQDRRMSRTTFRRAYPQWEEFAAEVDPGFSSGFWQRMQP